MAGQAQGAQEGHRRVGRRGALAVLSAIATTAGDLTDAAGAVEASSRGFIAAAVLAVGCAVVAFWRMPTTPIEAGAGGMHMH